MFEGANTLLAATSEGLLYARELPWHRAFPKAAQGKNQGALCGLCNFVCYVDKVPYFGLK